MKKLFGTDGIRGVVNEFLTPEIAFRCGRALGVKNQHAKVVIAKDTRISGDMLMLSLISGLISQGVSVDVLGLSSTPALAQITKDNYDFGIMITASHNPYFYNGIKIFDKTGNKLSDREETDLESVIEKINNYNYVAVDNIGNINYREDLLEKYISFIKDKLDKDFYDLKVCIDVANGGAVEIANKVFDKNKFKKLSFINSSIEGKNINKNCGATNLEMLKNYVVAKKYDIGFAFDGDADRIMIVDKNGKEIDGDDILYLLVNSKMQISKNTVVGTVMTNFGLENFLKQKDVVLKRVSVGDKYIKECMVKNDFSLGGESSGHIIANENCTGDAVYVATKIISILSDTKKSIDELLSNFEKYPNKLVNIKVDDNLKEQIMNSVFIKDIIEKYQKVFNNNGRILIRASGTEPLIRVLVEGRFKKDVDFVINGLCCEMQKYIEKIV